MYYLGNCSKWISSKSNLGDASMKSGDYIKCSLGVSPRSILYSIPAVYLKGRYQLFSSSNDTAAFLAASFLASHCPPKLEL